MKKALEPVYPMLTQEEIRRNLRGDDKLYVREGHKGFNDLKTMYTEDLEFDTEKILDADMFEGMAGRVLRAKECYEMGGSVNLSVPSLFPSYFSFTYLGALIFLITGNSPATLVARER